MSLTQNTANMLTSLCFGRYSLLSSAAELFSCPCNTGENDRLATEGLRLITKLLPYISPYPEQSEMHRKMLYATHRSFTGLSQFERLERIINDNRHLYILCRTLLDRPDCPGTVSEIALHAGMCMDRAKKEREDSLFAL